MGESHILKILISLLVPSFFLCLFVCLFFCSKVLQWQVRNQAIHQEMKMMIIHKMVKVNRTSYCSYARPAQPGQIRTRLCGPCIAAIAGD